MTQSRTQEPQSQPARQPWFNCAVIYEIDVKSFRDSNGDGIGDLGGVIERLDYIASLNVAGIWLQPFYKSPKRDNGYDVADYRAVDPCLGTLDDFDRLIREAQKRDLRVLADLPLNHTSDQHHWFQQARQDRNHPLRDYYIWTDKLPENPAPYPVFGPEQGGNWEWDDVAGQYYFHTFYRFMPDLNIGNPEVQKALLDVARFWMERGLYGFRLDAVPYLNQFTAQSEKMQHPHQFLKNLHQTVRQVREDAVLIAEANLKPKQMLPYFGDGREMDMLLNFYLCNHIFLSLATQRAEPIERAWSELPRIPAECNWANFLRNHDELSLDQLTKPEQQKCFAAFAPDPKMQLYGRGIRRRLAPMLDGDLARIKLIYSMLFSLPGTPVVNLGEEIGLGDDLSLKEREAARTPMQWTPEPNAGFSSAPPEKLVRPVVTEGPFSHKHVNVQAQDSDPDSLLNFFRRAIQAYRDTPAFGMGDWKFHDTSHDHVLLHRCEFDDELVFAMHNLSGEKAHVQIDVPDNLEDFLSDSDYPPVKDGRTYLNPYGYRWMRQPKRGPACGCDA